MQGSGVGWTEACLVRIAYQPEIIHLILGGFHGAHVPAIEIRPHRAAEEIDTPEGMIYLQANPLLREVDDTKGNSRAQMRWAVDR
jgi:hypothetical protein